MNQSFADDLFKGLTNDPKYIPSKYFYDEQGSRLFQEIMHLPEYYLFDCELEIFRDNHEEILEKFAPNQEPFELIEFGAGDGIKTKVLLKNFLKAKTEFKYLPVDISEDALDSLVANLKENFPQLEVEGLPDDYFIALKKLNLSSTKRKVVLFLGSNIGNFNYEQSIEFLSEVSKNLKPNDLLLIGMDLKKNPDIILEAYNDKHGVTRAFNLNLLNRINREMEADFNIAQFKHYPVYDPVEGGAKSYLMSRIKQTVHLKKLDLTIEFEPWEAIYTESSYKYTPYRIQKIAELAGFEVIKNFYDARNHYTNSLWKVV
jgi:dimethylhistidine N-methyltransferase